jgi:class 3 adenylate cyclase
LQVESLHWAVLTQMDEAEAEAPIREFGRKVVIASCAMALLVSLLALFSAHLLTRPLRLLAAGARRLGAGETGVAVAIDSRDEFGQLAGVFNDMADNIKTQTERLQAQVRTNHDLLLGVLPAAAVALREAGDVEARREFSDVSVLHAELGGIETPATGDARALASLNELITAFDEAAEQLGVERIRSGGGSYLAACGLSLSLPDHVRRTVSLAERMTQILSTFNRQHHCALTLAVGVSCGALAGSVVGRRKFLYELWGRTVAEAQLLTQGPGDSIRVTTAVRERLGDDPAFEGPERIETEGQTPLERWQRSR